MKDYDFFREEWENDEPRLLVHTSGSTGAPKPLWVEKHRMEASARITCDFLGLKAGDTALLCLPLDFIAGKMMAVRAWTRGLLLRVVEPCGHPLAEDILTDDEARVDFAAMVPLQVWNSLQVPAERRRLMAIRHLIIGGGAIDEELAAELRTFPNAVWSTYGMTETLSHIALRRLSGEEASEWYEAFPSVSLSQTDDGCLVVDAPLVCAERLVTNDIVVFDGVSDRRFRVMGRKDNVICTGGIKVQAEEVERLLRAHMRVPYYITKAADKKYGEVVAIVVERRKGDKEPTQEGMQRIFRTLLPPYWQPRKVRFVDRLPMTATGKVIRRWDE